MKKILYSIMALAVAAFSLQSCEDVPAPYDIPGEGGNTEKPGVEIIEITCAKAIELCNALEDGASSVETYSITGYITDVFATVSKGQQSFWLSDNNDGQKMVQAYWTNLPAGVEAFTKGSKVKITGKLLKYIKENEVITEVKNADVEILEAGDNPSTEAIAITCAKAIELCNALQDNASSAEIYSITGYITDVFATVSRNQQSFWLSDNNDGQKMVQAYWANLPEGVEAFTKGSKVTITGNLLKYVKDGAVTPEIKNADVVIIEQGGSEPDTPSGDAKHISVSEFLSKKDTETTYELTGVVANIANTTYGNFDLVEGDAKIYIYGLLDKEGNAKNFASLGISEGDEVTLTGVYSEFNDSPQIKNAQFVSVKKGTGGGDNPGGGTPDEGSLLSNGGFENWDGSTPVNWKSASTAGNATLSKSTDAHSGSYSVSVGAVASQNKRLAYKETELEAGTYVFTFYAKATKGGKSQTRVGYVPVKDGSVGTYVYSTEYPELTTSWKQVTYEFELKEKTTVCLVIMNPKGSNYVDSQDILIDDAKLVKK